MADPEFYTYGSNLPHWRMEGATYLVTWCVARGQPALSPNERRLVADALRHFDGERYRIYAYVVMDDHVHVIVRPFEGWRLDKITHSWKSYTSHQLGRPPFGRQGNLWQEASHDRIIRSESDLLEKGNYILANPFRRWPGLEEYEFEGVGGDDWEPDR